MVQILESIAQGLVSDPSRVEVKSELVEGENILYLRVAPEDMGRVIGKQGKIAKAIRTVMKSVAINQNTKVRVEILDD